MQVDFSRPPDESDVYPAEHNFRIIAESAADVESPLSEILRVHEVTSPLTRGRVSSGGRYMTYEVSVMMASRAEHEVFDAAVKALNGVRIML